MYLYFVITYIFCYVISQATYSDADILLGDGTEFIPPMSIIPLGVEEKKKTSSVSFNVEESQGGDGSGGAGPGSQFDKQETKKKNVSDFYFLEILRVCFSGHPVTFEVCFSGHTSLYLLNGWKFLNCVHF